MFPYLGRAALSHREKRSTSVFGVCRRIFSVNMRDDGAAPRPSVFTMCALVVLVVPLPFGHAMCNTEPCRPHPVCPSFVHPPPPPCCCPIDGDTSGVRRTVSSESARHIRSFKMTASGAPRLFLKVCSLSGMLRRSPTLRLLFYHRPRRLLYFYYYYYFMFYLCRKDAMFSGI